MEYECYDLDPQFKLHHGDNPVLLKTDDLAEAGSFVYQRFKTTGTECAVYQPRSQGYREIYQHKTYHSKRDHAGRFTR